MRPTALPHNPQVEMLRKKLAESEVTMAQRAGQVEEELSGVQPLIDAARKAVGSIKSDNLNEIRSLKMPPEPIRDVLEGAISSGLGKSSLQRQVTKCIYAATLGSACRQGSTCRQGPIMTCP